MKTTVPSTLAAAGRSRRGRLALVVAVAAALALVVPPAAAKKKELPERWLPALFTLKTPDPRLKLYGERVTFRQHGINVELELLDNRRRGLFLASAGIGPQDPFSIRTLGLRAWTWLVRIENNSDEPLTFRPPAASIYTKRPLSVTSPCDYRCLEDANEKAGFGDAEFERLLETVTDTAEMLDPGDRISKLMVFTNVPEDFKQFLLDMDGLIIDEENVRFAVPYLPADHKSMKQWEEHVATVEAEEQQETDGDRP